MTDEKLKRLKSSEVTKDGFYWTNEPKLLSVGKGWVVVEIRVSTWTPRYDLFITGDDVVFGSTDLTESTLFIGPLTPPEDE